VREGSRVDRFRGPRGGSATVQANRRQFSTQFGLKLQLDMRIELLARFAEHTVDEATSASHARRRGVFIGFNNVRQETMSHKVADDLLQRDDGRDRRRGVSSVVIRGVLPFA
jgi:hypothetical protein